MSEVQSNVQYRDIQGFPGYRVGDDGSVWSCRWKGANGKWKKLQPDTEKKTGYLCVRLSRNGRKANLRVHSLILKAFIGPRPKGKMGCHENDIPSDNRLTNLRWDTQKGNSKDAVKNGRSTAGVRNARARLTVENVQEIRRRRAAGESAKSIAPHFGITYWHVHAINAGQFWKGV